MVNIYIADGSNYVIRKVDASSGIVTTFAGTQGSLILKTLANNGDNGPATSTSLYSPNGVCVDNGQLYVVDFSNHWVRVVSLSTGIIATLAGSGSAADVDGTGTAASFQNPWQCAAAGSGGTIVVTDFSNSKIKSIVTSTKVVTSLGIVPSARGIWVDSSLYVYVSSLQSVIWRGTMAGGFVIVAGVANSASFTNGVGTNANFNNPYALTGDSTGNLYIADLLNNRIRKMSTSTLTVTTIAGTGSGSSSGDNLDAISASMYNPVGIAMDTNGNLYIAEYSAHKIR